MEGVKRINIVMAGFPPRNPYAMDVDRRINRNCYACGGFGHMAKNCRKCGVGMNRRIEIDQDNNNLNGNGGLVDPN